MREFTGKNVQDAIKRGLEEMGLAIDEADIEIVSEGGGGIFGIGAKKAVVRITPIDDDDDLKEDYSGSDDDNDFEDKVENFVESLADKAEGLAKKAGAGAAIIAEEVKERYPDAVETVKERAKALAEDIEEMAEKAEDKLESFGERIEERLEKDGDKEEKIVDASVESAEHVKFLTDFLDGLFERMGMHCSYDITQKGDTLTVNVTSDDSGKLIGHRGETLDAIQYITRLAIHKQDLSYRSVVVQTENYREKREQTLRSLAKRLAAKVERTGRKVTLEPMKPYERRIIHEALQSSKTVTTDSYGEEPNRYVVIMPKKDK